MPGLPNGRMFHQRFEQHHRPVADRQMTAECVIKRPNSSPNAWDDTTGRSTYPAPATVYSGLCRIQHLSPAGAPSVGDRTVPVADYRVTIVTDSDPVQVNDLIAVTSNDGDPVLVGRTLLVTGVPRGSITWQRDLDCQLQPATTR